MITKKMMKNLEWRVLFDPSGAIACDDPYGASYTFVLLDGNRNIVMKEELARKGFCHNARDDLKNLLNEQLKALDKPMIQEHCKRIVSEMEG